MLGTGQALRGMCVSVCMYARVYVNVRVCAHCTFGVCHSAQSLTHSQEEITVWERELRINRMSNICKTINLLQWWPCFTYKWVGGWGAGPRLEIFFCFPSHCLGAAVVGVERNKPWAASVALPTMNKPLYSNLYYWGHFYIPTTDIGSLWKCLEMLRSGWGRYNRALLTVIYGS